MAILVDANQTDTVDQPNPGPIWTYHRALGTAKALADYGVYWLEEPLPRFAFAELQRLHEASPIPIAGGNSNQRFDELQRLLVDGCYDILLPDVVLSEGLLRMRALATMAHAALAREALSTTLGFLVALFTVGERTDRRTSTIAMLVALAAVLVLFIARGILPVGLSGLVQTELTIIVTWVLGTWARDRNRQLETAERWLGQHSTDATLLYALGRLCELAPVVRTLRPEHPAAGVRLEFRRHPETVGRGRGRVCVCHGREL